MKDTVLCRPPAGQIVGRDAGDSGCERVCPVVSGAYGALQLCSGDVTQDEGLDSFFFFGCIGSLLLGAGFL